MYVPSLDSLYLVRTLCRSLLLHSLCTFISISHTLFYSLSLSLSLSISLYVASLISRSFSLSPSPSLSHFTPLALAPSLCLSLISHSILIFLPHSVF